MSPRIPDSGGSAEIEALCKALAAAHEERETLKERLVVVEEEHARIEAQLAALLHDAGTESIRYDRWVLSTKSVVSWKIPDAAKEEVVRLLKINVPELVKESVNYMSLNGYLRKQEQELESDPPAWWPRFKLIVPRSEELGLSMRKRG